MQELLALGDVSRLTGIPRHRIEYAIGSGSLAEPLLRIANKRAFTRNETTKVANYFNVQLTSGEMPEKGERCDTNTST